MSDSNLIELSQLVCYEKDKVSTAYYIFIGKLGITEVLMNYLLYCR